MTRSACATKPHDPALCLQVLGFQACTTWPFLFYLPLPSSSLFLSSFISLLLWDIIDSCLSVALQHRWLNCLRTEAQRPSTPTSSKINCTISFKIVHIWQFRSRPKQCMHAHHIWVTPHKSLLVCEGPPLPPLQSLVGGIRLVLYKIPTLQWGLQCLCSECSNTFSAPLCSVNE